jgi:hypothetical protein
MGGVAVADGVVLAAGVELLGGVAADRVQHPEPGVLGPWLAGDQAAVDQCGVQLKAGGLVDVGDRRRSVQCPATGEHRQGMEQGLFGGGE